jgi:3-oxoacyl-[acyl-carrier protein] reductase
MDLQLNGKCALVAGSSRGLGYAIALGLASEGCRVAINGRNIKNLDAAASRLQVQTNAEIVPIAGDVGEPNIPEKLIQKTVQAFGGLDLLVTNAGGPPSGKFEGDR